MEKLRDGLISAVVIIIISVIVMLTVNVQVGHAATQQIMCESMGHVNG